MPMKPIRLRDFIEDIDGWIYAVSAYDNNERAGCLLRYVPDENGERVSVDGKRFRKLEFDDSYDLIRNNKPDYLNSLHRVPMSDIKRVMKPEESINNIVQRDKRVGKLISIFKLPLGSYGCTGSLLCGLENKDSDIDMVVYGDNWYEARAQLRNAIKIGLINPLSIEMWKKVYNKRVPEISFETFILHEKRKYNRGEIDGTYFDLLFTRSYEQMSNMLYSEKGEVIGKDTIEAKVIDSSLSFDSPAIYQIENDEYSRVLSFTHTYSGQALDGEVLEASGVCEQHGNERWLIVGTTREAKEEYIVSKTLLDI